MTKQLPDTTFAIVPDASTVDNTGQKVLIVAQQGAAATATSGDLVENIANGGAEDALFDPTSALAFLIRWQKRRNQTVQIDAIPLDDAAGTPADGSLDWVGTATEAGTYTVIAGSERDLSYTIAVASGDTATVVGAAVEAAIDAATNRLLEATNTAGAVAVVAKNDGTWGNQLPLEIRGTVAGLTTSVTGMANGATDPTLTNVFDVIGEERYQAIVWAYPDSLTEVTTLLDARFNANGKVVDGIAFTAKTDSQANLETLGDAENSESLHIFGQKLNTLTNYVGGGFVEHPLVISSYFAGLRALRLDEAANSISDFVDARRGALDAFGGPALASKPYFNTPLAPFTASKVNRDWTEVEVDSLLESGISVIGNNKAKTEVVTKEQVTTYKTDSAGNPDLTFKFLNYVDTSSGIREYFANNLASEFSQSRLTTGDLVPGRDMANENSIRASNKALFQDLGSAEYVLVETGSAAVKFFDDNLVIVIDKANRKVQQTMKVPIITQIGTINGTIQVAFDVVA